MSNTQRVVKSKSQDVKHWSTFVKKGLTHSKQLSNEDGTNLLVGEVAKSSWTLEYDLAKVK